MAERLHVDPVRFDPAELDRAVEVLRAGGVVAYPTDTLYGLAADPRNPDAVARVFAVKGRPETSALTLIAADVEQANVAAAFTSRASVLAQTMWPGPLTIVAAAKPGLALTALAGGTTVGVRVPRDAIARGLAARFGFCITATSANRSGQPATADPQTVLDALPGLDLIVDAGDAPGGPPSTIVDATGDVLRLIRDGAVPWDRVLKSLQ
ncbi:MAG TPA: L-threonylcarbamoyladenylate synthase [Vicinamibacterales bacterium]|jgi:L-threonylcarbamoyladenylate synthase|nr:L-threonylcarbamoyladenylate synthase [Vicinamibacterales bacterium]